MNNVIKETNGHSSDPLNLMITLALRTGYKIYLSVSQDLFWKLVNKQTFWRGNIFMKSLLEVHLFLFIALTRSCATHVQIKITWTPTCSHIADVPKVLQRNFVVSLQACWGQQVYFPAKSVYSLGWREVGN